MKKEVEALAKYVWIVKEEIKVKEQKTASGIITATGEVQIAQEVGVVAAVGLLCDEKVQRFLTPGDIVLFEPTTKGKVIHGVEYLVVAEHNILAKL